MDEREKKPSTPSNSLAHRAFIVIGLAVAIVIGLVLLWYLVDVLVLAFAGVLVAIMLRTPADWLSARSPLSPPWALALVVIAIVAILSATVWLFGRTVAEQLAQLSETLPETVRLLQERIAQYKLGRLLIEEIQPHRLAEAGPAFLGRGLDVIQTTFGVIANIIIIFFVALFLSINPGLYVGGFLRLIPISRRERIHQVLSAMGTTLRWWLLARLFMMFTIGTLTTLGLWLLDAPLPVALGLLAGILDFIPFLGPIFAAIPAILVALAQSPTLGIYVALLYLAVQSFEGYVLEPIVEQRAVYLPPALVLLAQVVLGVLMGLLGILFATPLTAVAMVGVKMLYVEDLLGDRGKKAA